MGVVPVAWPVEPVAWPVEPVGPAPPVVGTGLVAPGLGDAAPGASVVVPAGGATAAGGGVVAVVLVVPVGSEGPSVRAANAITRTTAAVVASVPVIATGSFQFGAGASRVRAGAPHFRHQSCPRTTAV